MRTRRSFLLTLTAGLAALAVLVVPALAAELMGRITKVDVEAKKITVTEKGTDKEVEVTVTDETVYVTPKGDERKVDLEKLRGNVEKSQRGLPVTVTHEKKVASRIKAEAKKKEGANP